MLAWGDAGWLRGPRVGQQRGRGEWLGRSVAWAGLAFSFFSSFLSLFYFYFSILIIPWVFMICTCIAKHEYILVGSTKGH